MTEDHIIGCILGTAMGDALGLPYEGLSRQRAAKLFGAPDCHRLLFGRGMVSDDTEHTCLVAQALVASSEDVNEFQLSLAWRLRFWLLGLPAGVGLATLRSVLRLWCGVLPQRSGVFSAGNGPAMRAAIIGVTFDEPQLIRDFVRASTRITHTDPKAEYGAFAVAIAAHMASRNEAVSPDTYLDSIGQLLGEDAAELLGLLKTAAASVRAGQTTGDFAIAQGLVNGVSGYTYHTVPLAIHAWLSHPRDFRAAIVSIISCGGDTDSTAAIVGGIVGAAVGRKGIPPEWLESLVEWPRTVVWMAQLGGQLAATRVQGMKAKPLGLPLAGLLLRNLMFLMVVLAHGLRRLLPPY